MDLYYKQEVSVGLLVIAALIVFVVGTMWLAGTPLGGGNRTDVDIQFDDVSGLTVGDPVLVSGYNVGRVSEVDFRSVGQIVVTIELREDLAPHADATASVGALDFLGAMKINYKPGTAPTMLGEADVLIGSQEAGLTDGIPELKDQASSVMMGLQEFVTPETADNLNATLMSIQRALDRMAGLIDGPGSGSSLTGTMDAMQSVALRIDSILANPAIDESVNRLDDVMESLQEMTEGLVGTTNSLNTLIAKLENGEGSIGMALNDSTLHHDAHELLVAITELVDDMKERPGRYFHLKVF